MINKSDRNYILYFRQKFLLENIKDLSIIMNIYLQKVPFNLKKKIDIYVPIDTYRNRSNIFPTPTNDWDIKKCFQCQKPCSPTKTKSKASNTMF